MRESLSKYEDSSHGGVLFRVMCYEGAMTEQQFEESEYAVAAYRYLFATESDTYVMGYATDVQYDPDDKELEKLYMELAADIENIQFKIVK